VPWSAPGEERGERRASSPPREPEYRAREPQYRAREAEYRTREPQYRAREAEYRTREPQYRARQALTQTRETRDPTRQDPDRPWQGRAPSPGRLRPRPASSLPCQAEAGLPPAGTSGALVTLLTGSPGDTSSTHGPLLQEDRKQGPGPRRRDTVATSPRTDRIYTRIAP